MKWVCWIPAALLVFAAASCNSNDDGLNLPTIEVSEAPMIDPAHHQDKSCVECHTDWNLVAMHDDSSSSFNSDCISCHGNMLHETTLSEDVGGVHLVKMPWLLQTSGQAEINNQLCLHCHPTVDLLEKSAGNIRRQVDVDICRGCHTSAGPGRELYK